MIWKLKIIQYKEDEHNILSIVKAKWKKGKAEKKLYQIVEKKIIKYSKGNKVK